MRTGASIGVGAIPGVGSVQSVVELVTGRDYIEGTEVNRWLAAGGIVAGVAPGGKALLKGGAKAVERFFGGVPKGPGDDLIYRLGDRRESATRLGRKSQEAEDALGVHGVSGSTTPPAAGTPCSAASCSALEAAGFRVHRTPSRRDPGQVTIELPQPVTKEVADAFNEVFGR